MARALALLGCLFFRPGAPLVPGARRLRTSRAPVAAAPEDGPEDAPPFDGAADAYAGDGDARPRRRVSRLSVSKRLEAIRSREAAPPLAALGELAQDGSDYVRTLNSEIWGGVTETVEALEPLAKEGFRAAQRGERDLVGRLHDASSEFLQWCSFMTRANTLGLTEDLDVSEQLADRVRHSVNVAAGRSEPQPLLRDDPRFQDDADDRYADDALRDDWAAIHLEAGNDDAALFDDDDDDDDDAAPWPPAAAWVDDNDVDVVSVGASEWEEITATAFEVDTQVIEDTVLKGRWSVKNGRTVFERDDDAAA